MYKLFAFYRLKPDVKIEDYRRWSIEEDQQITGRQPGIHSFEVYEVMGPPEAPAEGRKVSHIIEVMVVDDWEAWDRATRADDMKKMMADYAAMADPDSEVLLLARRIE